MKPWLVAILAILALAAASAASATLLSCSITTAGSLTTYSYTLTSSEYDDFVTSLHIYAPITLDLIDGWTAPNNWLFDAVMDPDPLVGADICWYAGNPDQDGIPNTGIGQFSLTVPSTTIVNSSYVIPGCFGNWGYETQWWSSIWPGYVVVMSESIPVPEKCDVATPEPSSIVVLAAGLGLIARIRRYRRK